MDETSNGPTLKELHVRILRLEERLSSPDAENREKEDANTCSPVPLFREKTPEAQTFYWAGTLESFRGLPAALKKYLYLNIRPHTVTLGVMGTKYTDPRAILTGPGYILLYTGRAERDNYVLLIPTEDFDKRYERAN